MSLKDMIEDDAARVFLNTDDFAETVTYKPSNGTPRSISAQVWRMAPEDGEARGHRMRIGVANSATLGISSEEVNPGGDTVTVAYRPGGEAKPYVLRLVTDPNFEHMDDAMNYFDLV